MTAEINGKIVQSQSFERIHNTGHGVIKVPVPPEDIDIILTARSGSTASAPVKTHIVYDKPGEAVDQTAKNQDVQTNNSRKDYSVAKTAERRKPNLYALVIGVSNYVDPDLRLSLASKDAVDFADGLSGLRGNLYGSVIVNKIVDRSVTRDSIIDGLSWLEKQVTGRDIAVVFVAGHGEMDAQQRFWFLPADVSPERVRARAVPYDDFNRSLSALPGKTLLFLDACHAGRAGMQIAARGRSDMNKVIDDFAAAGGHALTIFASSQGREVSQENLAWGNGAFTKSVLEGLFQGRAGRDSNGAITPHKLQDYIIDRVKELTNGTQHPTWRPAADVPDFPIAVID